MTDKEYRGMTNELTIELRQADEWDNPMTIHAHTIWIRTSIGVFAIHKTEDSLMIQGDKPLTVRPHSSNTIFLRAEWSERQLAHFLEESDD